MSEHEPQRAHPQRRGQGLIAAGAVGIVVGGIGILRPDIAAFVSDQFEAPAQDEPAPITASPFPTVEITPTTTPSLETPTPTPVTPSPTPLGYGKGEKPISFTWRLPDGTVFKAKKVETIQSIQGVPNGHFNAAWVEGYAGACSENGTVWMDAHSSVERGRALMPPDLITQLGKKGLGVITLTTASGVTCDYELQWKESVKKFGTGSGTFNDFVKYVNPTGGDLRRQENVGPGIVFVSCDQTQGYNGEQDSSNNNVLVGGKLVRASKNS